MDRMEERCSRQSEQHMQKPRDGREHSGCSKQFTAAVCSMEHEGEREEEKCSSRRKQGMKGKVPWFSMGFQLLNCPLKPNSKGRDELRGGSASGQGGPVPLRRRALTGQSRLRWSHLPDAHHPSQPQLPFHQGLPVTRIFLLPPVSRLLRASPLLQCLEHTFSTSHSFHSALLRDK